MDRPELDLELLLGTSGAGAVGHLESLVTALPQVRQPIGRLHPTPTHDPGAMPATRDERARTYSLQGSVQHPATPADAGNSRSDDPFRTDRIWTRSGRADA
jgi:hypothetical protein